MLAPSHARRITARTHRRHSRLLPVVIDERDDRQHPRPTSAPADFAYGLAFAAAMGVIGTFLPAARAARLPIISALRRA